MKIIHNKLKVHSLTGRITEELMFKAFKGGRRAVETERDVARERRDVERERAAGDGDDRR